jgi:flavodoxin
MKTLVVCDSNFGNTKKIAIEVADKIGGNAKVVLTKDFDESDLKNVDLLIFGCPIVGWRPTEKSLEVLEKLKGKLDKKIKFATFDTRVKLFIHGDAKEKMAQLLTAAGATKVFESQAFFVKGKRGPLFPGEIEKAAKWATLIKSKM